MSVHSSNTTSGTPDRGSPDVASAARNPALAAALRDMEAKKNRSPWRKRLTIAASALLAVVLIGGAAWAIKSKRQADAKAKVLATIQQDPRQMREAVQTGLITREEGRDAMEQAFEQRMNKQMDEYFALKTQGDRNKYLDKLIDEQEARRKEWEQRAATRPSTRPSRQSTSQPSTRPTTQPGDQNRRFDPGRQLNRVQGGDPARKAQRAAFQSAMRQRMAERGIQGGGGRGGRGGWGGGGRGGGGGAGGGGRGGR